MGDWANELEWLAAMFFVSVAALTTGLFGLSAVSNNWRLWFREKHIPFPPFIPPAGVFLGMYHFFCLSVAVGTWFVWREGLRAGAAVTGLILPGTGAGSNPDPTYLADLIYLLFLVYFLTKGTTGFVFWSSRWFGVSISLEAIQWLAITGLTIIGFLIWWVPGIFFGAAWLWETYLFVISGYIANSRRVSTVIIAGHVDDIYERVHLLERGHKNLKAEIVALPSRSYETPTVHHHSMPYVSVQTPTVAYQAMERYEEPMYRTQRDEKYMRSAQKMPTRSQPSRNTETTSRLFMD